MNTTSKTILVAATVAIGSTFAVPAFADDDDCRRWGKRGDHHMKSEYMSGGFGPGFGKGRWFRGDLDLSANDVKDVLEARLVMQGNKNLKVGEVKEKNDDVAIARIVTKDGSLVQELEIDRETGRPRSVK